MADTQNKHSASRAQGRRRRAHASTKPHASTKSRAKAKKTRLPDSLRFTETKRGKTTIRRFRGRTFYRFAEAAGKPLDFIELFTAGENHSIAVRFQDKTIMHFRIDPGFTVKPEYADVKTGNWRPIKRWPLIHSQSLSA
jgi:hypothetical protein